MSDVYPINLVDAWHSDDLHIYNTKESSGLLNFRFEFSRLKDSSGGLQAEVTVYMEYNVDKEAPPKRIFGPVQQNLLASSWERQILQPLDRRAPEYGWQEILSELIPTTIEKHRGVLHVTTSYEWEQDEGANPFLLEPFIAAAGVTVLFGPGGTGKSTLAVGMALSIMTGENVLGDAVNRIGPVLWVDYEADEDEVMEREVAYRRTLGMEKTPYPLHYLKIRAKFVNAASTIRRHLHDTGSVLVVVDSVANARRGDAFGPEDTVHMFAVMGGLGVPVLAIDHMTKDASKKGDMSGPYGTVFTSNEARLTWAVMEAEMSSTPERVQLNMKMAKQNRFKSRPPRGVVLGYTSFPTGIVKAIEVIENEGVWENGLTTTQRVLRVFRQKPDQWFMIHEIALEGESGTKATEKEVKRLYDEGLVERKKLDGRGGPMGYRERAVGS